MALPSSGNTISLSQVNTELGRGSTATIDMNDSALRSLFGKAGSGTTISMSDGWGKSAISISLASVAGAFGTAYPGDNAFADITFNSNGTISLGTSNLGTQGSGNWATPTTTNIGSSYWIRATQTGSYGTGGIGGATQYGSTRGVWISLQNVPTYGVSRTGNGMGGFYYTFQIATDSGGSNIIATVTNIEVAAEIMF